jgi:hypothetical protein
MKEGMMISISSEAFTDLRWKLDNVMATVLKKMKIRDADQASITLKIDIKLTDTETVDSRTGEKLHVKNPTIGYKVNHKLEYKNESGEEGTIQAADSYLDCIDGKWVIRPVENGQMTIEDYAKSNKRKK